MAHEALIAALPKAELHVHIEGTLEPELMMALARRNGIATPFGTVEEARASYRFTRLQDFLDIYYRGANVLRTAEDFADLATAYFERAAADNVRHAEIFFDPQTHTERGIAIGEVIEGLLAGMTAAEQRHGITAKLILCFLRHLDEADAFATLDAAGPWLDRIAGVGLDSSELGHPPAKFERVFAAARGLGLRSVAHAGEEGPPEYVTEALDLLRIDRLDHGNRSLEDDALVARLAASGITLTVCPLSNLKLCVVDDLRNHPIGRMLDLGISATINSDDPAYFGGYVNDNFHAIAAAGCVSADQIVQLARNSFSGSFLPRPVIAAHLEAIDAVVAGLGQ